MRLYILWILPGAGHNEHTAQLPLKKNKYNYIPQYSFYWTILLSLLSCRKPRELPDPNSGLQVIINVWNRMARWYSPE